jgi:lysophospholipase L1-like esterase
MIAPTPPPPLSLVFLGDSLTLGDGDEAEKGGYAGRITAQIKMSWPGTKLTNLARSGWSSDALIEGDQGLPGQLTQAASTSASLYCVWIGSNDLWYLYEYGPGDDAAEREDQARYRANLSKIIQTLAAKGRPVFVGLLDDQSKRPVAKDGKVFPSITTVQLAHMSKQVGAYNEIIRGEAKAYPNVHVVDLTKTPVFTTPALLADDGNHPNAAGYEQIAAIWFDAVYAVIKLPPPPAGTN